MVRMRHRHEEQVRFVSEISIDFIGSNLKENTKVIESKCMVNYS